MTPESHLPFTQVSVAAIVRDFEAKSPEMVEILAFWRPKEAIRGGVWQLPGGKIEPDETGEAAAARETLEEVGLKVEIREFLGEASDVDPSLSAEQRVSIHAYLATPVDLDWQPHGDHIRWIRLSELADHSWPRANAAINQLLLSRFTALNQT